MLERHACQPFVPSLEEFRALSDTVIGGAVVRLVEVLVFRNDALAEVRDLTSVGRLHQVAASRPDLIRGLRRIVPGWFRCEHTLTNVKEKRTKN